MAIALRVSDSFSPDSLINLAAIFLFRLPHYKLSAARRDLNVNCLAEQLAASRDWSCDMKLLVLAFRYVFVLHTKIDICFHVRTWIERVSRRADNFLENVLNLNYQGSLNRH